MKVVKFKSVLFLFYLAGILASSCNKDKNNDSDLRFELLGADSHEMKKNLILSIFEPEIRVCYSGQVPGLDMEHVTKESFRVWLDPLKKKYQGVVESVVNSCDNPHLRVIADERVKRAFYVSPIGKNVKVLLDKNVDSENQDPFNRDYFPSSSPSVFLELDNDDMVVLHEIGHALGLADTYLEHASGCKEGQPISKMCDSHAGGFGLWEDDYNGILAAADRAFPGRSPEKNCQAESFRNQSHHSYVDFNLPTMVAGSYIDIKEGQYNNYVFPKCNRVWWTDLTFTCIDGSWTRTRGDWNADGLCHGSAEGGRYHTFGNL